MIKIVVIALIGTFVSLMLKRINSNLSYVATIMTGVVIISVLYLDINSLLEVLKTFSAGYGIDDEQIKLLIKILGISYVTQFGSSIAEDCGEKFLAQKIEFAGKIFVLSFCVPLLINLLNDILSLI